MKTELQATIDWVNEAFRARQSDMPRLSEDRDVEIDMLLDAAAADSLIDA